MKTKLSGITTLCVLLGANLIVADTVYAYGSSAQRPTCKQPVVKIISPASASGAIAVSAGSEFSFEVSSDAKQKAITMSAKDIAMPVQVTTLSNGKFQVTGKLPDRLTDGYASVEVTAPSGNGKCAGQGKVLVQIN